MSEKEKPLPTPPSGPFGRRRQPEEDGGAPLVADEIARAVAEGKLDEFMASGVPDNEYARKLVSMMLQMSGMLPGEELVKLSREKEEGPDTPGNSETSQGSPAVQEDVMNAVGAGDVRGLMDLLKREHEKRSGSEQAVAAGEPAEQEPPKRPAVAAVEKDVIDGLIKIADDNGVGLDWIVLRALKLYVRDYRETGRL